MRSFLVVMVAVMVAVAIMMAPMPAEAGNCGVNGFAAVQVSGFHQPAFVSPFAVGVHPQFVSTRGVVLAAPQVSPVFIQAVPHHVRVNAVNVNAVKVNAVRGQQFRQVQTRGAFGRQRTVTTIR